MKTLCSLALVPLALVISASPSTGALLAYYSFDGDSSLTGGSYTGSLSKVENGGATVAISSTLGRFNGAADFTSTVSNEAYLSLSQNISFASDDAWSVSLWIRRRSGSDNRQGMVLGDISNATDFIWRSDNSTQVQGLRFRNSNNITYDFGGFPDNGDFEHWALVSDGAGTISAYRNGVAQPDITSATGTFNINAIGAAYNATTHTMNGQIDELYIFNEAIGATTVSSLFNTNTIPEPSSLALLALGGLAFTRRRRTA